MARGLCARCKIRPQYVTEGGNASGYCWDCRRWHQKTLQRIKRQYPYAQELARQNGVCLICRERPEMFETFHYDHDHVTGEFRGLLCHQCNLGLGGFHDSISMLQNAIWYLEDSRRGLGRMLGDYRRLRVVVRGTSGKPRPGN
jgi:hypothetical protein